MNKIPNDLRTTAYIDKELDKGQTKDFENEMLNDESLLDEVAQYAELKDKIKLSYANEHTFKYRQFHSCERKGSFAGNCKQAIAAALVLAVGLITLNSVDFKGDERNIDVIETAKLKNAPEGFKLKPVKFDQNKLILHISSSNIETLDKALKQAESLLTQYEDSKNPLELEVIANSGGVDLLRASVSPYAAKIKDLQSRFEKVQFVACFNTLARLSKNGKNTDLLPGVTADLPVVDKIIGRIQNGWTYIKI